MAAVLGVDGCPGGWVGALVPVGPAPRPVRWLSLPDATAVLAVGADAVGIDIPVGLPDRGPRRCDLEARRRLPGRGSTVFPAPLRAVLGARDYADARARSVAAGGRSLSVQTWNIVPKIREVDAALSPADEDRVVEVHPELCFAVLAGHPLPPKRTGPGRAARIAALSGWVDAATALPDRPATARPDDALDALAAAWTALRWLHGDAEVLPAGPVDRDARGRPQRIVV